MNFFGNPLLEAAIIAWFLAQFCKFIYESILNKNFKIKRFFSGSGGMPSSHSAVVVSLCVTTFKYCGHESSEFAIAVVVAAIVMFDAFKVRRAAGEQAKVLNSMKQHWFKPGLTQEELEEFLGHKPIEVAIGALVGFVIGMIY